MREDDMVIGERRGKFVERNTTETGLQRDTWGQHMKATYSVEQVTDQQRSACVEAWPQTHSSVSDR